MNNSFIDKVALIHIVNRKLLMLRSHNTDVFYSPGGKREGNETDEQTLIREIQEEIGVKVIPDTITYFETFSAHAHGKSVDTMVRIKCYTASFEGNLNPQAEIAELKWFTSADGEMTSETGRLIVADLKKKGLID